MNITDKFFHWLGVEPLGDPILAADQFARDVLGRFLTDDEFDAIQGELASH